jgi:hypothetical protein
MGSGFILLVSLEEDLVAESGVCLLLDLGVINPEGRRLRGGFAGADWGR